MNFSVLFTTSVIPSLTAVPAFYQSAYLTLTGCWLLRDKDSVIFMYLAFKKVLAYSRYQKMLFPHLPHFIEFHLQVQTSHCSL